MTPEERQAAAAKMREEVEADRALARAKQNDTPTKTAEVPKPTAPAVTVEKAPSTPPVSGGLIDHAAQELKNNNQRNLDALNEAQRALGLPEKK